MTTSEHAAHEQAVLVPAEAVLLEGTLVVPGGAQGVVLFAHGSGSSRFSPRNRAVASTLNDAGIATLLIDLLSAEEEGIDRMTAQLRFDIDLLAQRLISATDWLLQAPETQWLRIGYFGASTGAAAALLAAPQRPGAVAAIVSRGGRPDLAGTALPRVQAPTLLIVGGLDLRVIEMNREAFAVLGCKKSLEIVPGATHLFEEPGMLGRVAGLARDWFQRYLGPKAEASLGGEGS